MEQDYSKDLIYGNFLTVENEDPDKGGFPDDCETLAMLQSNIRKVMMLGRICGYEYLILSGCEKVGTQRTEGYVYAKGEILYHKAQIASDYCYIEETYQNVTANNETYNKAYSLRTLTDGQPDGAIPWSEFKKIDTYSNMAIYQALQDEITKGRPDALKNKVDSSTFGAFKGSTEALLNQMKQYLVPKGTIVMWSGSSAPEGWALCDGQQGRPDMRGRFVIGANSTYPQGTTGGSPTHSLTSSEIPSHYHSYKQTTVSETTASFRHEGSGYSSTTKVTTGTKTSFTENTGGSKAFSIMPPYYALAFIIKL